MVLEEVGISVSRPLRDRRARNTDSALRLSRRIIYQRPLSQLKLELQFSLFAVFRDAFLQLDGIALHLVIERGTLDAEKFGRLFLVAAAFCECLKNGGSLQVVESLYAAAR